MQSVWGFVFKILTFHGKKNLNRKNEVVIVKT